MEIIADFIGAMFLAAGVGTLIGVGQVWFRLDNADDGVYDSQETWENEP